ncbi:P-loop NTPase, partial [Clostridioides difficile]
MADCNSCPSKGNCNSQSNCSIENNPNNKFGKIIGVMSGKGGVGKSTVTALLANKLNKMGYKVGILDSDITGPSIPRLMGVKNVKAYSDGSYIYPVENSNNIKVMSINLMIDDENEPVVWRGPLLGGVVKQFYTDVLW